MTVKELLNAMSDASDAGDTRVGIYQPAILKATRRKNGDTQITLGLVTNEFTSKDVLDGLVVWLAVGTRQRVIELEEAYAARLERSL